MKKFKTWNKITKIWRINVKDTKIMPRRLKKHYKFLKLKTMTWNHQQINMNLMVFRIQHQFSKQHFLPTRAKFRQKTAKSQSKFSRKIKN